MLKDMLIGILIRVVGQLLKTIFANAMIILQQIENDPSIINNSTKKIRLFEELIRKYPKQEKIIIFIIELMDEVINIQSPKEEK